MLNIILSYKYINSIKFSYNLVFISPKIIYLFPKFDFHVNLQTYTDLNRVTYIMFYL